MAIVKANIWKELPNFLRLSSDKANNTGPEAPRPVLFFPSSKYMDPIPSAEKPMTPKKMIKDKIEKQWSESFVENLNFIMVSRNTIKRRYEDKGIDLIKLINDVSYYKHVKKKVNSRGNLEFQHKY